MNYSEKVKEIKSKIKTDSYDNTISEILDLLEEISNYLDRQTDPDLWHPVEL